MKLVIEINMDNAAFEDMPGFEAERILREFCKEIPYDPAVGDVMDLRDFNGNTVGKMEVK